MESTLEKPQTETTYQTCLVTIVNAGISDSVIKIYPAEHKAEKIWLDNTQGVERWEQVKRLMYNYAKRGQAVPKPALYHASSKDLRTVEITDKDIPVVTLEGAVFEALPEVQISADLGPKLNPSIDNLNLRMEKLEGSVASIADAIGKVAALVSGKAQPLVSEPARLEPVAEKMYPCLECPQTFKTVGAVAMHKGRFHKTKDNKDGK